MSAPEGDCGAALSFGQGKGHGLGGYAEEAADGVGLRIC